MISESLPVRKNSKIIPMESGIFSPGKEIIKSIFIFDTKLCSAVFPLNKAFSSFI